MDDFRDFELCEPAPFLFSDNGHVAITDGNNVWMVIVEHDAMTATSGSTETSHRQLVRHAEFYRDLASAAISRGDDEDGKVRVQKADVLAARSSPDRCTAAPSQRLSYAH